MTEAPSRPALTYLGWSGFVLDFPGAAPVFIDPPEAGAIPLDRDINLLITHGHPEHVMGAARWLGNPNRGSRAQVIASSGICRYLKRKAATGSDRFHPSEPGAGPGKGSGTGSGTESGARLELPGLVINIFACTHMPLLPPEKGSGITRIRQLARHPGLALSIAMSALRAPMPGPILGFHLHPESGPDILFWGEGLHRCADIEAIRKTAARLPAQMLIAAVEPEDEHMFPDLIAATGASQALPYEAHMPWRRDFGMGWADLDALSSALGEHEIKALRASPGNPVDLAAF